MEGDIPSASMVLAKYRLLRQYLEGKLSTITEDEFKNMINTMLKKIDTYVNEALACDAILLATALNPSYRLSMIQKWYPSAFPRAKSLLEDQFQQRKQALNDQAARDEDTPPPEKNTTLPPGGGLEEDVDFFSDAAPETYDELAAYLGGKYRLPSSQAADCLTWWKVGSNFS
jgi:hypothetical protein